MSEYPYNNILIIKHGSLGDIISCTSIIKAIRDYYKSSNIALLTSNNFKNFFKNSELIDQVILDERKGIINSIKILNKVNSMKFNLIIDLQNSTRTFYYNFFWKLFSLSRINSTHKFSDFKYTYNKKYPPSVIEGLSNQVKILNIFPNQKPYLEWLKKDNVKIPELYKKDYFIINPGCSKKNQNKRWPLEKYAEICNYLIKKNIIPVLIGAEDDKLIIQKIMILAPNSINLVNKSPLFVVYNLSFKSLGALSNDTGPAHLIAATNCKIHLVLSNKSNVKTVIPQSKNVTYSQSYNIADVSTKEVKEKINFIIN